MDEVGRGLGRAAEGGLDLLEVELEEVGTVFFDVDPE